MAIRVLLTTIHGESYPELSTYSQARVKLLRAVTGWPMSNSGRDTKRKLE
jgi:hypothetical protein